MVHGVCPCHSSAQSTAWQQRCASSSRRRSSGDGRRGSRVGRRAGGRQQRHLEPGAPHSRGSGGQHYLATWRRLHSTLDCCLLHTAPWTAAGRPRAAAHVLLPWKALERRVHSIAQRHQLLRNCASADCDLDCLSGAILPSGSGLLRAAVHNFRWRDWWTCGGRPSTLSARQGARWRASRRCLAAQRAAAST